MHSGVQRKPTWFITMSFGVVLGLMGLLLLWATFELPGVTESALSLDQKLFIGGEGVAALGLGSLLVQMAFKRMNMGLIYASMAVTVLGTSGMILGFLNLIADRF